MSLKLLHEPENDDPILSVVNIIDIFLVIMEMMVKKGEKIERYKSSGQIGQGEGAKAGTAYRMKDGGIVYVPE
jgi:hypothetical protein